MSNTIRISSRQLMILTAIVTLGDGVLLLPAVPTADAKRDAWISSIIGLGCGLLAVLLIVTVSRLAPRLTLVQMARHVFGKWAGGIVAALFLSYLIFSISAHIRELGDFNVSQIMPDTPIEAIHILLLLLVIFAVRQGLETFSRVAEMIFPWILLFFFIVGITLIPDINIQKVLPVLDNGFKPVLRGSITCIAYPFLELVVFMMIFPHVKNPHRIRRDMLIGAAIGGVLLILTISMTLLVIGAEPASLFSYPGYDLAKRVSIGHFIERIEAVMGLTWIITTFFKTTVYMYCFSQGMAELFNLQEYRMPLLSSSLLVLGLSIIVAPNLTYYNTYSVRYWPYMDATFSLLLPVLLWIGFAIRKKLNSS